jgi:hypothetical protein
MNKEPQEQIKDTDGVTWVPLQIQISLPVYIQGEAQGKLKMINGKPWIRARDVIKYE